MLILPACYYPLPVPSPVCHYHLFAARVCLLLIPIASAITSLPLLPVCYQSLFPATTCSLLPLASYYHLHGVPLDCSYRLLVVSVFGLPLFGATTCSLMPLTCRYLLLPATAYVRVPLAFCYHLLAASVCLMLPFVCCNLLRTQPLACKEQLTTECLLLQLACSY